MTKTFDAKSLQEKLEGLYKDVDLTQDDQQLLKNERASFRYQDPAFRAEWETKDKEARAKKEANPVFREARVERNKKLATNQKRNQKISETVSDQYKDPAFKEFKSAVIKDAFKDPEKLANLRKGTKTREGNGWAEKNAEAAKKRRKPIQTPYGRFKSKGEAVEGMTKAGVSNAGGRLSTWLKTKPEEYFYIKEEQ